MLKFNPTITAHLVSYIREGGIAIQIFVLKVEHTSYTMGNRALPDIYTLALGPHMYHFHTSDQRKVSAYISHIALALKC